MNSKCNHNIPLLLFRQLRCTILNKFLSFHKEIMGTQYFPFYIILSSYLWFILFYQDKDHNVRQIRFRVCIKMHRCKRRVCKRKTLFGQPNIFEINIIYKYTVDFYIFVRNLKVQKYTTGRTQCVKYTVLVTIINKWKNPLLFIF